MSCYTMGGAQRVFIRLANRFAEKGVDTTLFTYTSAGPLRAEVSERVKAIAFSPKPLSLLRQLGAAVKLARLLRREQPDAVVATLYQTNMLVSLVHKLTRSKARLVLREAIFVSREWPKSRFYPVAKVAGPALYRRASYVVAPARDQIDDLCTTLDLPREKVLQIGNPTIGAWMTERSAEALPVEIAGKLARPLVLAVGRLSPQKGFDVLIRAFAAFSKRHGGVLLILGEGECRAELEQLVGELGLSGSVIMPGVDPNPFRYFKSADLFVLSSRYEGLPNVLAQAVAMQVRSVSTDCPSGPRELLEDGALGELVPVDDVAALADAMTRALQRPAPQPSPEWLARYDEDQIVERYMGALFSEQRNVHP
jgi:glycosyltransferase involved in cell wall biosynthesis